MQEEKSVFSKSMSMILGVVAMLASLLVFAAVKDEINARTAPVGDLCLAGQECAAAPVVAASGPRSGADIYGSKCIVCECQDCKV